MFESILFCGEKTVETEPRFFRDLQLHYLFDMIRVYAPDYDISTFYYTFPVSAETIALRKSVFSDFLTYPSLPDELSYFCNYMKKARELSYLSAEASEDIKAASFSMRCAQMYVKALDSLNKAFRGFEPESAVLCELKGFALDLDRMLEENGFKQKLAAVSEKWDSITFKLTLKSSEITVVRDEEGAPDDRDFLREIVHLSGGNVDETELKLPPVFKNQLETSYLEDAVAAILKRSDKTVFAEVEGFYAQNKDFIDERLIRLESELQFYISAIRFMEETKKLGYDMCFAKNGGSFEGTGVYDLALVHKNRNTGKTVVSNDFSYPAHPSFFVVTGPNQGGKTTFARSLGQAVYFAMTGLFVNAESLSIPELSGLMTHFENEENTLDNAGKLKDEILRLKPMLDVGAKGAFMILNELFTTATTTDAIMMGKRVTKLMLSQGNYGVYVTHLSELAAEAKDIKSLVAESVGEDHRRTFKILVNAPEGLGHSDELVKEYELTYEDIMRILP